MLGADYLTELARDGDVDLLVVATSGTVGFAPTLAALDAGKPVALANKETLIMAGHLVTAAAAHSGAALLPIDSEHSAIWQCLQGEEPGRSARGGLILTASGGAFRDAPVDELASVTPAQALRHPTWSMGPKITIDSATLMNKGLEVIEAHWLFGLPFDRIDVVLHRQSVIHSLVEFVDGSVKAQLGLPDMRLPIQYALSHPRRLPAPVAPLDLPAIARLDFAAVDERKYPCLALAYAAGRRGGILPDGAQRGERGGGRPLPERRAALRRDRRPDRGRAGRPRRAAAAEPGGGARSRPLGARPRPGLAIGGRKSAVGGHSNL